jgi:putative spermidine/putrescine transport system permease protein
MAGLVTSPSPSPSRARSRLVGALSRVRWWRAAVLAAVAVYLLGPLLSALWFTVYNSRLHTFSLAPYGQMFHADGFLTSVRMTFFLALATIAIEFVLLVPAMIAIQLRLPRLRPVVESIAMVPLVVSPVALTAGISTVLSWGLDDQGSWVFRLDADLQSQNFPLILPFVYAILVLPFAFRSLDAGLRAVDLRTLVEAARGLGAPWPTVLLRVILPNLRTGLLSGAVLTLALVFGEYTIASILGFVPFAVWIVQDGQGSGQLPLAVSLLSLLLSWFVLVAISFAGGRRRSAPLAATPSPPSTVRSTP